MKPFWFDTKKDDLLGETDKNLLEFLIAEFQTSATLASKDPATEIGSQNISLIELGNQIVSAYKDNSGIFSRSDLFKLDTVILNLQSTERLIQRAGDLRFRYSELAGSKFVQTYTPAPIPTSEQVNDPAVEPRLRKLLLADLQQLLYLVHWNYIVTPLREKLRKSIVITAMFYMVVYTMIWAGFTLWLISQQGTIHNFIALCLTVIYMGLMGGYISSQRRMQMTPADGDPLTSFYTLENGTYFLWFSPLLGAVFAVVLAFIFKAGLIEGALFPKFSAGFSPDGLKNHALLYLWSFIAGFAERFVPDALDHLISQGEEAIKTPPPQKNLVVENKESQIRKSPDEASMNIMDDEHDDGCDVETELADATPDEALPAAEGGVEK